MYENGASLIAHLEEILSECKPFGFWVAEVCAYADMKTKAQLLALVTLKL